MESGLLQPGETLYFDKTGEMQATILADGAISCNGERGSIHQVARKLRQAPCNGWELWYFYNPQLGERQPIDRLRQAYRRQFTDQRAEED